MNSNTPATTAYQTRLPLATVPVMDQDTLDQAGWSGLATPLVEPSTSEPEGIDAAGYTDLQSAMALAEQMRQLLDLYRALYGELYPPLYRRN
ncbi:hypothetical protein [Allochromatium palmeri]|uniref:Uncharacterized protein n=1 Tax=Allochromatium palmeri TaxID=231048 RepID=A0A6N8EBX6_9GAMM|nr:hypothetical protein [Allochromatium palmeri]MTW20399.1 hypothetical protein [Allochromatium palmeri]